MEKTSPSRSGRLRWAFLLAVAIIAGAACVADIQEPWMSLVVDGIDQDGGRLVSYCWRSITAGICADGDLRDPPMSLVRTSHPVAVQIRTKAGLRELQVGVTRLNPRDIARESYTAPAAIDPARTEMLMLDEGTHFISVFARWDRGDAYFLFGLRVERP
jgi:hypothetical protein